MNKHSVIIIGAGPAGLAIAGRLSHIGFEDYIILEASDKVGNSWRNHYDRLHLHTVKQWSHLPYLPFPEDYPLYVPRQKVVDYLDQYANKLNVRPKFGQKVTSILKNNKHWHVKTTTSEFKAQHVVIATGVNNEPKIPHWKGEESFQGTIVHSRFYKNPSIYKGKKVLVIGMGNTGAEIAYDLAEHEVDVHLSVRGEISLVPRDLNGQPVQVTAKRLAKLPFGLGDWLGSQIRKVYFGNVEKYGLKISKTHPTVQLRETGKTPVIDIGTIDAIKKGKIKILTDIISIGPDYVGTEDGQKVTIQNIILATGYLTNLESFIPGIKVFYDKHGLPKSPIGIEEFSHLYFIGYDNYKVGGILGTINDDSKKIVDIIATTDSNLKR